LFAGFSPHNARRKAKFPRLPYFCRMPASLITCAQRDRSHQLVVQALQHRPGRAADRHHRVPRPESGRSTNRNNAARSLAVARWVEGVLSAPS